MSTNSHNPSNTPLPPPPAPPLPPPSRYGQRAATAIARFAQPFFYGSSRPSSAQGHREVKTSKATRFRADVPRTSSPSSSQTAVHKTGIVISALDVSPYRTHAILAGREILKTIRVQDATCNEEFNLRSEIVAYASTHNNNKDAVSAQHRDQLAAYHVKWSHGNFDSTIATAASNGRIVIYDLNRPSVEIARLHEHTRQVHRVAFNPHQPAYLLSGSQDGTMRLWDLRALGGERSVRTCGSWKKFLGNSEGIRDVKWSPVDGVVFAVGTDNGVIQRWDFAKESAPSLKLHAHEKTCNSIDWHPSGRYIASGGSDRSIKIWDFKSSDRRMKPSWALRTPQNVQNLKWRPELNDAEGGQNELKHTSQIATTYDNKDPRIHVWDFKRPHAPFQEVDRYDTPATDFLWHSEDLLWSVGSTGTFTQNHLVFATKPSERRNINALAISSSGQISFFAEERLRRHFSIVEPPENSLQRISTGASSDERFSSSQSANEGSLEEPGLLSSSLQKRRQKFAKARVTTGSSLAKNATMGAADTQAADETSLTATFKPSQFVALGHVLGLFDANVFSYLARNYMLPSVTFLNQRDSSVHETIRLAFQHNAEIAEDAGQYRLAQSWRILGQMAHTELLKRAEASKQLQLADPQTKTHLHLTTTDELLSLDKAKPVTFKGDGRNLLHVGEDLSNMSTPIARPSEEAPPLLPPDRSFESLNQETGGLLGPAWKARDPLLSLSNMSESSSRDDLSPNLAESSNFVSKSHNESPELYSPQPIDSASASMRSFSDIERQMHERRSAISNYRARPRAVLRLDDPFNSSHILTSGPPLDRYDSNESFQMFSASVESDRRSFLMDDSFGDRKLELSQTPGGTWAPATPLKSLSGVNRRNAEKDPETMTQAVDPTDSSSPLSPSFPRPIPPVRRPSGPLSARVHRHGITGKSFQHETPGSSFEPMNFLSIKNQKANLVPWSLSALLLPLIDYHLNVLSDCQMPSLLALWLATLFPSCFARRQITSYMMSYLSKLSALQLFEPAANLRNACEIMFPEVLETSVGASLTRWFCRGCHRSLAGKNTDVCLHCKQQRTKCPICESDTMAASPDQEIVQEPTANLWTWCQGCGHGGHSSCLALWFSDAIVSEGTCAVAGCNHDCVDGSRRETKIADFERLKRKGRRSVIQDNWAVDESKAVGRARDIVVVDTKMGKRASKASIISNKPPGPAERRVRLKVPEDKVPTGYLPSQEELGS